jgi:hypothetical protein
MKGAVHEQEEHEAVYPGVQGASGAGGRAGAREPGSDRASVQVHPVLVGQWKKQLLSRAAAAFRREGADNEAERTQDELLKKIGELTVERDFLARGLRRSR